MESNLNDIMKSALDSMRTAADGDTVLGKPIVTGGGVTIIPVSKVSIGFASGGLDSSGNAAASADAAGKSKKEKGKSFGGGGGSGVSVVPVAFLIVRPDGDVSLLSIAAENMPKTGNAIDSVSNLLNQSPDILARFKSVFSKKKDEPKSEAQEADETAMHAPDEL